MPGAEPYAHDGGPVGALVLPRLHRLPGLDAPLGRAARGAPASPCALPRLPGHGTTWQDMRSTRWEDWYAEVERAFADLRDRCADVFVMGLSMGGALALRLAELHGDGVRGLVLVNPSVHSENKALVALPVLKHVVRRSRASATTSPSPARTRAATTGCRSRRCTRSTRAWADDGRDIDR